MFYLNSESDAALKFDPDKVQPFTEDFYDVIPSMFHFKFMQLEPAGVYMVTYDAYRPDLISYKIYGHVQYKMLLMEYNSLFSVVDLVSGTLLKYPALASMENILLSLKAEERQASA
jgi:hypothetical protein